jgi:hypothetical protein
MLDVAEEVRALFVLYCFIRRSKDAKIITGSLLDASDTLQEHHTACFFKHSHRHSRSPGDV